ncbi:MAG: ribbon-helix-helix domain-containing protein [Clostridiaceae bacterium]|nr:ribbon-helix-helix domain-containing protein [Clostridiaceae bacterium]
MKKRITFTFEPELIEKLQKVSKETMIPQAKIVEKAVEEKLNEMIKGLK